VPTESSEVADEAQVLETAQSKIEDTDELPSSSTESVKTPAASIEPTDHPQSQSEELEEDDTLVDSIQSSAVSEESETATEPPTSESNQSESDIQEEFS
jgi:hypothetical protein